MRSLQSIGIAGAGQMGSGIAQCCIQSGYAVRLADIDLARAKAAVVSIRQRLDRMVEKQKIEAAERDRAIAGLTPSGDIRDLKDVDFVIEAAPEDLALKKSVFRQLDELVKPEAIIATNTSSLGITQIAAVTRRPTQVIGMHFMNPPPLMKLIEIIRALQTSDATYQTTLELSRSLGKTTVTSKDRPGFIVNRMLIPLINEACFQFQEGLASAEEIDLASKLGIGHSMGPLEQADLIGLDTCLAIAETLHREFGDDKYRPADILRTYVAAGWLGRKSGRGFHRYDAKA